MRRRTWIGGVFMLGAFSAPAVAAVLTVTATASARFELAAVRGAVERAESALQSAAPEAAARVARRRSQAEAAAAAARREPFWRRDAALAAAWSPALVAAHRAVAELALQRDAAAAAWQEVAPRVAAAVAQAQREVTAPGLARHEVQRAQRAVVQLDVAQRLAAEGRYDQAVATAAGAIELAGQVNEAWEALHHRFDRPADVARWRQLIAETIEASKRGARSAVVVYKLDRRLEVYQRGRLAASYDAELGARGLLRKLHSGDRATPEGRYRVVEVKVGGQTRFYKALLIDYPNAEDRRRFQEAKKQGRIPGRAGIGGLIEIHGHGGQGRDWTDGCVALRDREMDELLRVVKVGTPVTIVGKDPR